MQASKTMLFAKAVASESFESRWRKVKPAATYAQGLSFSHSEECTSLVTQTTFSANLKQIHSQDNISERLRSTGKCLLIEDFLHPPLPQLRSDSWCYLDWCPSPKWLKEHLVPQVTKVHRGFHRPRHHAEFRGLDLRPRAPRDAL